MAVYQRYKSALRALPEVTEVSGSFECLGKWDSFFYGLVSWPGSDDELFQTNIFHIDADFLLTYGFEMSAGQNWKQHFLSAQANSVIVNETFVKNLGEQSPVGLTISLGRESQYRIAGVVKDIHFESLHHEIKPAVFRLADDNVPVRYIAIKVRAEALPVTLARLREIWHHLQPDLPFDYFFFDEHFDRLYHLEESWSQLTRYVATLAIFIACLGLFGLATLTAARRTKEIGIRKVLGATVANVMALLSKDFVKLVLLANLISWPAAYFAMNKWLQNFAYRIDISWWVFALAGGLALVIALVTVSTQAVRAALANPVDSLRYE